MVKRINIKLNEFSYKKLKNLSEASIDKNINLLIDRVEKKMPLVEYGEKTHTVNAYSDTYERLDKFRITYGESRDNILTRMLLLYDQLDTDEPQIEIPFKLTSPLNKKLVLEGVTDLYEVTILTSDDSVEYKSWMELLDWDEIMELISKNKNKMISFNKPHYKIDINYR